MKRICLTLCSTALLLSGHVSGAASEIWSADLHLPMPGAQTVNIREFIDAAATQANGQIVDTRVFYGDSVYYRILIKKPNGRLVSVILDATTGNQVSSKSSIGRDIRQAMMKSSERFVPATASENLVSGYFSTSQYSGAAPSAKHTPGTRPSVSMAEAPLLPE